MEQGKRQTGYVIIIPGFTVVYYLSLRKLCRIQKENEIPREKYGVHLHIEKHIQFETDKKRILLISKAPGNVLGRRKII